MQVFLSWSKKRSEKIAQTFKKYLPHIIQAVDPFLSSEDIEKGTFWSRKLTDILSELHVGLIIVTPENKDQPWLMYETGALTKALEQSRVTPILFGHELSSVSSSPLGLLQGITFTKDNMFKLTSEMNRSLPEYGSKSLSADVLRGAFDLHWENWEKEVSAIMAENSQEQKPKKIDESDFQSQVLEMLASQRRQMLQFGDEISAIKRQVGLRDEYSVLPISGAVGTPVLTSSPLRPVPDYITSPARRKLYTNGPELTKPEQLGYETTNPNLDSHSS